MRQESISERDERQAKEAQEAMPETAKAARMNGEILLKVAIDSQAAVVVKVAQQGQPHPKGVTAEIHHTIGPMNMTGDMVQRVKDAAINHARGQVHEFSISEYEEEGKETSGEESGSASSTPSDANASQIEPPVGSTKENPEGGGAPVAGGTAAG